MKPLDMAEARALEEPPSKRETGRSLSFSGIAVDETCDLIYHCPAELELFLETLIITQHICHKRKCPGLNVS